MTRFPDWQLRLQAFVRARRMVPFAWGENDCATFAADAVEAITGERLMTDLRGLGARDAMRVLREFSGVRGLATAALGASVAPRFAAVGDVVAVRAGKREALAVCNGGAALATGPAGVVAVPMSDALAAWKV